MPWDTNHRYRANFIAGFVAVFIIAPLLWSAMDREPAYHIDLATIIPPNVETGETESILWDITVLRTGCTGRFQRQLIDSAGVLRVYDIFEDTFVLLDLGKHKIHNTHPFVIPEMERGPAELRVLISTSCTWAQKIWPVTSIAEAHFEVVGEGHPDPKGPIDRGQQ
jgi:hypothetical protein